MKFPKPSEIPRKYWYLFILLIIVVCAFWFRSLPARYGELQALDPFYLYRMSEHVAMNNFQLPELDMLRNHPYGYVPATELLMPYYLPAIMYHIGLGWGMDYFNFGLLFPAIMGALAVLVMFFLGKELFGNNISGLFAAFFLAVVPAFITRTSAGFFEKEPIAGLFTLLTVYLFLKAYNKLDWKYGILSGLSLFIAAQTWGGTNYFIIILSTLAFVMLLINKNTDKLLKSFIPMFLTAFVLSQLFIFNIFSVTSSSSLISIGVLLLLLVRYGVEKYNLVEKKNLPYIVPGLVVLALVAFLMGSMFFDSLYNMLDQIIATATMRPDVTLSTVAESQQGSLNAILQVTGSSFSSAILPQLQSILAYFSIWIFSFIGLFFLVVKIYRSHNWLLLLPIIWLITSMWGVLGFIRLSFIIGPPFALTAAFFFYVLVNELRKREILKKTILTWPHRVKSRKKEHGVPVVQNLAVLAVALIMIFALVVNFANGYAYSTALGPSICFNNPDILIDGQKCVERNENGELVYASGQPWYDAFDYLRHETPEGSGILSWWDFGYWFESRGERPAIVDGAGSGNTTRKDVADWFVSESWEDYEEWIKEVDADYILMDYTLPGKYGAISKIASWGEEVIGILPFQGTGSYEQENKTIYEFRANPYVIWLPIDANGNVDGTPLFLVEQNGQFVSRSSINNVCTSGGIIQQGNESQTIGGCVAMTDFGVFYVPEEVYKSTFSKLMFMNGWNLPVEKVFDNSLIKIYKVNQI